MLAASLTREPRADDAAIRRMCGGETSVKAVVEAVVQRVLEAMQDEKLFTARDAVRDLEFTLAQAVMTTPQLDEDAKQQLECVHASEWYVRMETRAKKALQMLDLIYSSDGWQLMRSSKNSSTYYRSEPDSKLHSFKIEGVIEAPLHNIAAVLYEVDLFHLWFPMLKYAKTLYTPSRFNKVAAIEVKAPWPVSNRECMVDAFGIDVVDRDAVLLYLESLPDDTAYSIPEPRQGAVRCDLKVGGFHMQFESPTCTRVFGVFNLDPKLEYIPASFMNFVVGKIIHWYLHFIGKAASYDPKDTSNPYVQAIAQNPNVYDHIHRILQPAIDRYNAAQVNTV